MKSSKKVWLTGSVLVVAALVAVLAIPVGASAKVGAMKIHCAASNDAVVDISQFANDEFSADAVGKKCTTTVHFSYASGKLAAPAKLVSKVTVDANGAFSGQFANKLVSGDVSGQLASPGGTTGGGTYKIKITVGIDFKPTTVFISISW